MSLRTLRSTACLLLACLGLPLASAQSSPPDGYGLTKEQAIEVCKPAGERAYLARLVCPDDSHPAFARIGSVGLRHEFPAGMSEDERMKIVMAALESTALEPGSTDHHMIDGYSMECGKIRTTLYLDMYHCDRPPPDIAPTGFTILR